MPVNKKSGIEVKDPTTWDERSTVASSCVKALDLKINALVDGMDNRVAADYGGWPDRLYVIDKDGKVAYQGGPSPFGFKPDEMEKALAVVIGGIR